MNIFLIRHGEKLEADKNHTSIGLTQKGFKQANLLGKRLSEYKIDKIYSSDMRRAIQTAEVINEFIKTEINKHESDIRYPPDGECGADVWNRVSEIIKEIIETNLKNIAIVTHGGVIRALIAGFLGLGQEKRFLFGDPLENCSISMIKYNVKNQNFSVNTFNDISHLEYLVSKVDF